MKQRCFIFVVFISSFYCQDLKPIVETPLGKVQGYIKQSHGGRNYSAFQGIPYAKPPVRRRRFREPVPVEPWTDIRNATSRSICAQFNMLTLVQQGKISLLGKEDCLHVNVYVPGENPDPKSNLDVVVTIHGGGYMIGSAEMYTYPDLLMDHDIIFVTFNYRLGILGFLSTENNILPGNNGLKDQNMALRWVHDNIASFGGNPKSVTIVGASAGGASVQLHYFSQLSKGLFQKGISLGGSALNSWSLQEEASTKARRLAEAVGCPTNSSRIMVRCLRRQPVRKLQKKLKLFLKYKLIPFCPFAPVIEKSCSKAFLCEHPYKMLMEGRVHDVPWIASASTHEGILLTAMIQRDLELFNSHWDEYAPSLLDFNYTLPKELRKDVSKKIQEFYLGKGQAINPENFLKLTQMVSDRLILVDIETAARLKAKASQSPVYYYHFNYLGDNNKQRLVTHTADAQYYFGKFGAQPLNLTPNELKMKDVFLDMLLSYAKTGVPTIKGAVWKPTGNDKFTYLNISGCEVKDMKLYTVDELTPRKFWSSLGFKENENLIGVTTKL